jgi:imidazolonepropionase-like amidohydrolase
MNITDDLAIRKMIEAGKALGPKLHLTAPYIEGEGGFAYQMPVPAGTEEVREFVRYWRSQGVESLKAYTQVSREVLGAAIDEGHRLGMHVTGHLCSVTYREAASLGIDNLEHGFGVASDFVADKRPDECPQGIPDSLQATDPNSAEAQSLFRYLVENDVAVTSTMAVFGAGARDYLPSPDALDLMADRTRAGAEKMLEALGPDSDRRASVNASMAHEMALEKAFADAGGTLVVGTDPTGWGGTIPGPGSHAALYLLEEAGFTPLEVIAIATRNGARLLGVEQETGTIEAGKAADLILVDGDPESNLHDLSNVSLVFRDGIAYDSARIIEAMKGQVGR